MWFSIVSPFVVVALANIVCVHGFNVEKMHGETEGASPYSKMEVAILSKGLVPSVRWLRGGDPVCHAALRPARLTTAT